MCSDRLAAVLLAAVAGYFVTHGFSALSLGIGIESFGDVRGRYEGIYYADNNDNTGAFPNFNAINTGSPFDVTGSVFSPQNNVDRDRQRERAGSWRKNKASAFVRYA